MATYDALVVLGAAIWANATPSPALRRRALHAAALYQKGLAPKIIGSGGLGRFPPSEAEMIRRICFAEDIPEADILLEDASHSTLENVLFSARIPRGMNARTLVVVSDKYHLARATLCFRFLGFEVKGSGPDRGESTTPLRKWLYFYLREIVAVPHNLILLAIRKKP